MTKASENPYEIGQQNPAFAENIDWHWRRRAILTLVIASFCWLPMHVISFDIVIGIRRMSNYPDFNSTALMTMTLVPFVISIALMFTSVTAGIIVTLVSRSLFTTWAWWILGACVGCGIQILVYQLSFGVNSSSDVVAMIVFSILVPFFICLAFTIWASARWRRPWAYFLPVLSWIYVVAQIAL